ncbi:MAG TPA: DUF4124 domain-containing protein [Pseudomonadota bacterium]|nr:DUF4124 domain-containing protein [Rhodanobacteraceae bacterium]MBP9154572.1 DUF4124 domain-containing protein [Xanthomonadales bacterium]HQW80313.1 DUF4124 domain-containing protein [Pseudomonadota bacterium]
MKAHLAICLIVTLLSAFPANAEKYYKWQDESGAWHYSSKPPKEQQAEALTVRAKAPSQSDDEIAAQARKDKARNGVPVATAEQCEKLRANLKVLDSAISVRIDRDGSGESKEMTMEEQRAEAERTRDQIERFCD